MMRLLLPMLLVTALAGCKDAAPTNEPTVAALQDALDRISPTLGLSGAVTGERSILIALLDEKPNASLPLTSALDRLTAGQHAAVLAGAIQLAANQP